MNGELSRIDDTVKIVVIVMSDHNHHHRIQLFTYTQARHVYADKKNPGTEPIFPISIG